MDDQDVVKEILEANDEGKILGYRFSNVGMLIRAFTRKGFAKEEKDRTKTVTEDQRPLATLGDAVLKVVLADSIFHSGQKTAEDITKEKIEREKDSTIAKVAEKRELWRFIRFGGSEKKGKLEKEESILATTIEAVIGALYIDTGCDLGKTKEVIGRYF
jgi:ribonuclease-3